MAKAFAQRMLTVRVFTAKIREAKPLAKMKYLSEEANKKLQDFLYQALARAENCDQCHKSCVW